MAQQEEEPKPPKTRILFVFDGSQSMFAQWQSGAKIDIARELMFKMLDSLNSIPQEERNFEIALRVYGHQKPVPPQDCNDTKLEVPFGPQNINKIKGKLEQIVPKGTTPIARSLLRAGDDFPPCQNCRNVIILITDGVEACDEDPCAVSRMLQEKGIILKPFVIGIGLDKDFRASFECVGNYYDASKEKSFEKILGIVISQALNNTTAQVNLLDIHGKPMETNVNMTFYDQITGQVKYNFIHTINHRGVPDTLILDPLITYDMVVHTIPAVRRRDITINPGHHNVIAVDAPQGYLELKAKGFTRNQTVPCIIREAGDMNTLHVQNFNDKKEKLIVGTYDLEILTLPRYIQQDVEINQSETTTIQIPAPGSVSISSSVPGSGSVYVERGDILELIYNLNDTKKQHQLYLQSGNYRVVFRPTNAKESIYTVEKRFRIESGGSSIIKL